MVDTAKGGQRLGLGAALLDLVVPQECGGCGRAGTCWCPDCAGIVRGGVRRLELGVPAAAAGEHTGPLGRAVVAYKDAGLRRLARPLGRALAESASLVLGDVARSGRLGTTFPIWVVPIPSRVEARRRRGEDHMAVLASHAARELRRAGWRAHRCRLFSHAHDSRDQVGLDREARRANLAGALRASDLPGGALLVVDDVTTTGATLDEAVRALRAAPPGSPLPGAGATDWPILAATITVSTRVRGHASGTEGY
jgi:predicted amidophosphoribosyltransferase